MTRSIQFAAAPSARRDGVVLTLADGVSVRDEYFGILAWRIGQNDFNIVHDLHADVLAAAAEQMAVSLAPDDDLRDVVGELEARQLIELRPWAGPAVPLRALLPYLRPKSGEGLDRVAKPLWAHLQPFTSCNQECLACYCHGGPAGDRPLLDDAGWHLIVQRLANHGVRDVYLTGGETLIFPLSFHLAELVLDLGLTCGLSTNAMSIGRRTLLQLKQLRLSTVQVSLDGGTAATNDHLRGVPGAFDKTLAGIQMLAEVTEPVINTVVTPENLDELGQIVELGRAAGCQQFKFFPEKRVGRGADRPGLDPGQLQQLALTCTRLRSADTAIESIDNTGSCGSADSGFAVDQHADVYPCIFGVADPRQRAGNLLESSIDDIWFDSSVFRSFRQQACDQPCHRCEPASCS